MNYSEEIENLIQILKAHPLIDNVQFVKNAGVRSAEIEQTSAALGFKPDENLLEFYRFSNGLTITVSLNMPQVKQHINKISDFPVASYQEEENPYIGLSIVSFEELFHNTYFNFPENDPVDFGNDTYALSELSDMIKPFDKYSEFACFGTFINPAQKVTQLLMLDAHYDSWFSSRFTNFEIYFSFLMKSGCICEARRKYFYACNGHKLEPIVDRGFLERVELPDFFKNF